VSLRERLNLEHPVVQAGMGGRIADGLLAGTVSAAGGLGTVGIMPPEQMRSELAKAREIAGGRAVAANLLVPFATSAHVEACAGQADAVVLHGGFNRRLVERLKAQGIPVLSTVGTVEEARRALAEGADGLVVQGVEAGGHLVGTEPALDALGRVLAAADGAPVLLAGGIADAKDVAGALNAGADAAVAGTRFLLTDECPAHPEYKQRVLDATRTVQTQLFGIGWPMRHRVVPNAATDRWCRGDELGPRAIRALQSVSAPLGSRLPQSLAVRMTNVQRPWLPLFGPSPPLVGMSARIADASPLYAGETALRIDSVVPAAAAVRLLAGTD
jgi:nitronate monooxygenase